MSGDGGSALETSAMPKSVATNGVNGSSQGQNGSGPDLQAVVDIASSQIDKPEGQLSKEPTEDQVREAAYSDWKATGETHGHDVSDFYNAQNRLRAEKVPTNTLFTQAGKDKNTADFKAGLQRERDDSRAGREKAQEDVTDLTSGIEKANEEIRERREENIQDYSDVDLTDEMIKAEEARKKPISQSEYIGKLKEINGAFAVFPKQEAHPAKDKVEAYWGDEIKELTSDQNTIDEAWKKWSAQGGAHLGAEVIPPKTTSPNPDGTQPQGPQLQSAQPEKKVRPIDVINEIEKKPYEDLIKIPIDEMTYDEMRKARDLLLIEKISEKDRYEVFMEAEKRAHEEAQRLFKEEGKKFNSFEDVPLNEMMKLSLTNLQKIYEERYSQNEDAKDATGANPAAPQPAAPTSPEAQAATTPAASTAAPAPESPVSAPTQQPEAAAKPTNLTPEALEVLETVDRGGVPGFVSNNLHRILIENGISEADINSKKPEDLIRMLAERGYKAAGEAWEKAENEYYESLNAYGPYSEAKQARKKAGNNYWNTFWKTKNGNEEEFRKEKGKRLYEENERLQKEEDAVEQVFQQGESGKRLWEEKAKLEGIMSQAAARLMAARNLARGQSPDSGVSGENDTPPFMRKRVRRPTIIKP